MGNVTKGQSTTAKTAVQKSPEQIIREACRYSGHYQSPCAHSISYAGLSAYLNLEAGKAMSWRPGASDEVAGFASILSIGRVRVHAQTGEAEAAECLSGGLFIVSQ